MTSRLQDPFPENLRDLVIDPSNLYVVVGLPDNKKQWNVGFTNSDNGFVRQIGSWETFSRPVRFSKQPNTKLQDLIDTQLIPPSLARLYVNYALHRRQFRLLQKAGLNIQLGATKSDFVSAANAAFSKGGMLSVIANAGREENALEFIDGYLKIEDIPRLRSPSGTGLFDVASCCSSEVKDLLKSSVGSSIWVMTWAPRLTLPFWLRHRLALFRRIAQTRKPVIEHMMDVNESFLELARERKIETQWEM